MMNEIMSKLFEQYNFIKTWEEDNRMFFVNANKNVVSYFILNFVDCSNISDDEADIRKNLIKLEDEYVNNEREKRGLKYSIIDSFENKQEVSQLDKNTSAIYLVKFSEVNMMDKNRNLIYAIEESPDYFKRYILPYTEKQVAALKRVLEDYKEKNIIEILSELADEEENYYSLMNGTNKNSVYELVIRMFAKIPFLQYKFKATSDDISLEKMVNDKLNNDLKNYDKAIIEEKISIEELLDLEEDDINEAEIEKLLNTLVEGAD